MGNQAPTQAREAEEAVEVRVVQPSAEQRKKRELHLREQEDEEGRVTCSCGYIGLDEHSYNLHIECGCPNLRPLDGSGWPARHFETVPYVTNTQRAVVSKGSIDNAAFSWITLTEDFDDEEVRKAISQIPSITAQVGLVAGEEALESSLVGVSARLWRRWDASPPEELVAFTDKRAGDSGEVLLPTIQGGQLILMVKSKRADACYEVTKKVLQAFGANVASSEYTQGFGYMGQPPYGGRDLTGFVDGTRNPDHLLRAIADEVVIFPDDHPNDEKHVGGTYMFAGRFVHNLPKFFGMPDEEKSEIIGRDYTRVRPHHGYDHRPENPRLGEGGEDEFASVDGMPPRSHVARAFGSMMRQAYPYRRPTEEGLFFTAYARFLSEIDTALNRMCGHYEADGSVDNMFKITKAVECNYYYVPSLTELADLPHVDQVEQNASEEEAEVSLEEASSGKEKEVEGEDKVKVFFEYCTNCGYKTLFLEKKRLLESLSPRIQVVGNPHMPRLAAFEITLEDGTVLWSKASCPDGHNNYPHAFPTNEQLAQAARRHIAGLEGTDSSLEQPAIYRDKKTRVGVW